MATKAEVVAELAQARAERDLAETALAYSMGSTDWDARERVEIKGDSRYTFYLCRSAGSLGGIVVTRFDALNNRQAPQYTVNTLDQLCARQWPHVEIRVAIDRLRETAARIQGRV